MGEKSKVSSENTRSIYYGNLESIILEKINFFCCNEHKNNLETN
jgi:hypothetical protein